MEDTGEAEKQRIDSAALHRISCSCVGSLSSVALFCCIFSFGTFFGFIRVYTDLFSDPIFLMKNLLLSLTSLIIALESVWASVLLLMSLKDFSLNLLPLYRHSSSQYTVIKQYLPDSRTAHLMISPTFKP